jgi:nucleotide-binding universal stress UspA family protein
VERPLIVGVDGSDPSLLALDWAADAADRHNVPLRVVHSSLWERYEGHEPAFTLHRPPGQILAEHIVAKATERAGKRHPTLKVTGEVLSEDVTAALVRESAGSSMAVVGSRGRGELAGLLLGSVGLEVAARAECPVVVVRGAEQNLRAGFRRIAVGIDDEQESAAAVAFAFREAELRHSTIDAVHAWRWPAHEAPEYPVFQGSAANPHLRRAEQRLDDALRTATAEHPTVEVLRETIEGPARRALLNAASTADLLVVGARRRRGHIGMQLGPVNHAVLHHAACPVAVVPSA